MGSYAPVSSLSVGSVFGRLTVEWVGKPVGTTRTSAVCLCACGNRKTVDVRMLKRGDTRSCGCLFKESLRERNSSALVGQKFTRLTVVSQGPGKLIGKRKRHNLTWNCVCDCGGTVTVSSNALSSGNTKSCGCLVSKEERQTQPTTATYVSQVMTMHKKAMSRDILWTLQIEDAAEIIQQDCTYCGAPPAEKRSSRLRFNGLDRVDSSKGYVSGNVVACCKFCNFAKNTMSVDEFKAHNMRIYNKLCTSA